ncbi:MAG: D-tyrosyl-tRNA(Tyr) deacylase [Clostridia bacterium]|nr:D-tyrosyl-tRNA(Tyr) deacylase [Clostridia bacterium]
MRAVLQRVQKASVTVDNELVSSINQGFLILLGVEASDDEKEAEALAKKISGLRIFTDENDKMNLSLADVDGEVLVVSNFTLCADCKKGRRPNFERTARGETANSLYEYFCRVMENAGVKKVAKGIFGADMKVELLNDGPVTIIIDSQELAK